MTNYIIDEIIDDLESSTQPPLDLFPEDIYINYEELEEETDNKA